MAEILIVQDEPILNELLCETLSRQGYKAHSVNNTNEALNYLKDKSPSVIISEDVTLLKKFSVLPCAVVMLSNETGKILEALKFGALDFSVHASLLEKTYVWVEIGNRLRALANSQDSEKQKRMIELFRSRCSAFQEAV